ncbi:MAG TPA: toll/interleukin-1 receptor domain-containing protein [Thermoanaerobaculia bacterium]|nr:toll/interleukin-1 receptor domain-containing protein [Thermoanaerobaculia bacterium]
MSPQPLRVFVSHSSEENKAVLDAIAEAFRQRSSDFTLLMDTEELKAGDAWRARINLWLGACDAAVLVLSEQALTKPWVLYEAAILSYRNRGGKFLIVPVILGDPEGKLLKDRRLDAPHISEIQAVRLSDPEEIADAVMQRLAGYQAEVARPIGTAVSRILTILDGLPEHLLNEASDFLKLKLPWEPGEKPLVPFAERLLGASTDEAIDALLAVRDFLEEKPKKVKELCELVAASWVDPKAIEELPEIAQAATGRAVALNAALAQTARMYQVAACPTNRAHFISCVEVFPEPQTLEDEIVAKVEKELHDFIKPKGENVRAALKRADKQLIFVAIPSIGFTDAVVERLQKEFPSVTFFFLTGNQGAPVSAVERNLLKLIVPQLNDMEETTFNANHGRLMGNVVDPMGWSK